MRKILPLLLLLISGCGGTQQKTDALAGLELIDTPASFKHLRVGYVLSPDSTKVLRHMNSHSMTYFGLNGQSIPSAFGHGMERHFAAVYKLESVLQAKGKDLHLIGVMKPEAKAGSVSFGKAFFGTEITFSDLKGNQVAVVSGRKEVRVPYPNLELNRKDLLTQAVTEFEKALLSSEELRAFAETVPVPEPTPPPIAAAPAVATPAVKTEPAADLFSPTYSLSERSDDFAIVIGIEDYKDIPDAGSAARDAKAFAAHMRAMGVPQRHIIHLSDQDASYTSLRKYLGSWLSRNVKPHSRLYFYFSGHGAPEPQSGKAYLVPWDGDPSFLEDTAYPIEQLYADLKAAGAKETFVALDACFSGSGGRSVLAKGARPLVTKVDLAASKAGGLTVLTAASGDQITTTLESEDHGIFTYFLLKGLGGAAKDAQGRITASGLFDYLKPEVQDEARLQNREQTPTFNEDTALLLRQDSH